jgi:hypothetical protein
MAGPDKRPDVDVQRKGSKDSVIGEGSMELDLMRLTGSSSFLDLGKSQLRQKRKASKQSVTDSEDPTTAESSPTNIAAHANGDETPLPTSTRTEPHELAVTRTYAVTMYSSALSNQLSAAEATPRTKARTFAVKLPESGPSSPPPPPRGAPRKASTDNFFDSGSKATDTRFRVWSDSPLLNVKTPELAAPKNDPQAWIRLAFKPSAQPRRTREYVYIEDEDTRVPIQRLGFDLEYI